MNAAKKFNKDLKALVDKWDYLEPRISSALAALRKDLTDAENLELAKPEPINQMLDGMRRLRQQFDTTISAIEGRREALRGIRR